MHFHLEIVMPPTNDVEKAVTEILSPFDEGGEDEYGNPLPNSFWDWWVIGGRWSGAKIEARIGADGIKAFHEELSKRKVTVSSLVCGKQTLQPDSQVPMVDQLWNEMFPNSGVTSCPLFSHANVPQAMDICTLDAAPADMKLERVIIAGPHYDDPTKMRATHMLADSIWNGVNHVESAWDGQLRTAIDQFIKKTEGARPDWLAKNKPKADWLVVTVDYHS